MNWSDVLKQYSNRALGAMLVAQRLDDFGGVNAAEGRGRAIEQLRRVLGQPEIVHRALRKVGPVEVAVLRFLLDSGGNAETVEARRRVESQMALRPPDANKQATPDYQGLPSFDDAIARATSYGLIFSRDSKEVEFSPGKHLFVPEPVRKALAADPAWSQLAARLSVEGLGSAAQPEAIIKPKAMLSASAPDFQRDLSRYLRHVRRQGELALTTQGWIYKSNFKLFLAALNAPGDAPADEASSPRLWFMRRLLTAMNELLYAESGLRANPEGELLELPMAQRIKLAFNTWCDSGAWNELNRIATEHHGFDYRRDAPPELSKARSVVLRAMARLSGHAERWVPVAQLVEFVKRVDYQFLFPRKQRYRDLTGSTGFYNTPYYATNNPYNMTFPTVRDERLGWDEVEQQVIHAMLGGPLHWLGLIELGYANAPAPAEVSSDAVGAAVSAAVAPLAYRLTTPGAWLLGMASEPEFIESGGRVLVQPNFTVIAMEPVSDAVLIALDEFADSQGGDRAVTYTITRQSMYKGQRMGWDAERIAAFLEKHQGSPIPPNVRRSLEDWQAQHRRITFYRGARVLQYADEAARAGAREALKPLALSLMELAPAVDLAGPAHTNASQDERAEVSAGPKLEAVVLALSEAGWMPLVTRRGKEDAEGVLRIGESGAVQFKQAVPSLFVLAQIAPFMEFTVRDTKGLKITAASVRAAMSKGMSLDELLATLAHLHDGQLPARLEDNIRSWAGFYGDASLSAVHLLELASMDVLNNLLHDEQVGPYLRPIEGSTRPLALVDAEHVDLVRRVLVERGVDMPAEH
jgi:hypothetical protein